MAQKQRVVVMPVDESSHSEHAVTWAASHVVQPSDHVYLVTVLHPTAYPSASFGVFSAEMATVASSMLEGEMVDPAKVAAWERCEAERVATAEDMLGKYAQQMQSKIIVDHVKNHTSEPSSTPKVHFTVRVLMDEGNPGPTVVKYALEKEAELVVVGSRGLGSIESNVMGLFGLGSVSDYLLKHLHCPALVVKAEHMQHDPPSRAEPHTHSHDPSPIKQ